VNNCSYVRGFCNKGITNPNGVFSGIARHNMYSVSSHYRLEIISLFSMLVSLILTMARTIIEKGILSLISFVVYEPNKSLKAIYSLQANSQPVLMKRRWKLIHNDDTTTNHPSPQDCDM
jgi:hypothetical protein